MACSSNTTSDAVNAMHSPSNVIRASFHQGNDKFGSTKGIQCSCISLFCVSFSAFKSIARWTSHDLEYVIEQGDILYKSTGRTDYLSCPDLPRQIQIESEYIQLDFTVSYFGFLHDGTNCIPEIVSNLSESHDHTGILFFCKGYTFSIITARSGFIYVIDSHSRNECGEPCPDGTGVILKFNNLIAVAAYIKYIYYDNGEGSLVQYDVQYIKIVNNIPEETRRQVVVSHQSDTQKHNACRRKRKRKLKVKTIQQNDHQKQIDSFRSKIYSGPVYICVICNCTYYKRTVKVFHEECYPPIVPVIKTNVRSFDKKFYICVSCSKKCLKNKIPCQAVYNKLSFDVIPPCLQSLNCLESALISKRLLFKKIMIMPKGQFPKVKGAICNVPIDLQDSCNVLPRNDSNSGILFVKLKRKLQFKGHVYFQPVCPSKLNEALLFLKANNQLYADIEINLEQIPDELLNLADDDEIDIEIEVDENLETTPNHLDSFRCPAVESLTMPLSTPDDLIELAPGENKTPQSILKDEFCEELAFPKLFPRGRFGYKVKRDVPLSPVKYFSQRLLNYTQRFASVSDYIFFAQYVLQIANLCSSINMAFKKVSGNLTAGMFSNYKQAVQSFVAADQGYTFMKCIKGTPAYWKRFLLEVLAMIRQLGCPTFFLTLSCADLYWEDLIMIISQINNLNLTRSDIQRMSYIERCELLNKNAVFVTRHFQYRVEVFFSEIIMIPGGPLGKVLYYAIRVEFQFRGSPHTHTFIWILNAPKLNSNNIKEYTEFVDSVIQATVPNESDDSELHNLVKTYQIHQHSKSCRKYKNVDCRYGFGHFFTERTIIASPLSNDMPLEKKSEILSKRNACLCKVKQFIDLYLQPKSPDYISNITIQEILQRLEISATDYYEFLAISSSDDFEIHLKRLPNSCFVNNYNPTLLRAWQANMDLQVVHNYSKAVSYMCAYFSKSESESSQAMKLAAQEVRNMKMNQKDAMFKLASAFTNSRQLSVQEAIYHCLPALKLRWVFPSVLFINTNLPSERIRVCKSEEEIQELDPDSTDVFKSSIIDKYMDRPNQTFSNGKYAAVANICLALFASYYRVDYAKDTNDYQPEILTEDFSETHHDFEFPQLPKTMPLMTSKYKLKRRKVRQVLRFPTFNKELQPEKYAHHLLILYYPFRKESELTIDGSYCKKLSDSSVANVVETNRALFEPNADEIDLAWNRMVSSNSDNSDVSLDDNSDTENEELSSNDIFGPSSCSSTSALHLMPNDDFCALIRTLNKSQRQVFDAAFSWARNKVKCKLAGLPFNEKPVNLFLTGGAGSGKSHVARAIYHAWEKTFSSISSDVNKIKVLTIAPTGVAAINVNGTTVNSALGIPPNNRTVLPALSSEKKSMLRNMYSELQAIVIDEVSMISNIRLLHIHNRLCEIFGCQSYCKFANLSVIVVGDLLQLPPIRQSQVFALFDNEFVNICHPWYWFQCCELIECMRQQDDKQFISLLNAVRTGNLSNEHIALLKTRVKDENEIPANAVYIFATNVQKDEKNAQKLATISEFAEITLIATDALPKNITDNQLEKVLNCSASDAGGLTRILKLKKTARVMLTSNVDINDRLINGQMGEVFEFHYTSNNTIDIVFIKFDDPLAGLNQMRKSRFAIEHNVVPVYKIESRISTGKSSSVTRVQFPLTLAYACTVHKVQGLTLDKAVFSFDLGKQRYFNNGQVYVALSRVRKLDDLFILGEPTSDAVRADEDTLCEYTRLRSEANFFENVNNASHHNERMLSITLLNTRSLQKHAIDIANDPKLLSSIICLTETQLSPQDQRGHIERHFPYHEPLFNNSTDKYCSVAMLVDRSLTVSSLLQLEGVQLTKVTIPEFQLSLNILLIYRKQSQTIHNFREILTYMIRSNAPDIILGDFNINALSNESENFLHFMSENSYSQIVSEPTHILGSLLDHVHVSSSFQCHVHKVQVNPVYFSDHDAVTIDLSL